MGLKLPPAQTIRGVIIYHEDAALDDRTRQIKLLRDRGFDIDTIAKAPINTPATSWRRVVPGGGL